MRGAAMSKGYTGFRSDVEPPEAPPAMEFEYWLLKSALNRAIADAVGKSPNWESFEDDRRTGIEWLRSENREPWSCMWICKLLGYNDAILRRFADRLAAGWEFSDLGNDEYSFTPPPWLVLDGGAEPPKDD